MKLSAPLGLLLAIAPVALACDNYGPSDTAEECFTWRPDDTMTDDFYNDDAVRFRDYIGDICVSVSGSTMSVTYKVDTEDPLNRWFFFNSQVFVGNSIDDVPRTDGGAVDSSKFNFVSDEFRGNEKTVTVEFDISDVTMDSAQCDNGEQLMTIMPHGTVGDYCENPLEQGEPYTNWAHFTDMPSSAGPLSLDGLFYLTMGIKCQCQDEPEDPRLLPAPPKDPATGSGDPHFKTWTGDKFDYHGECDLVLVDNPSFDDGKGLKVHVRTTRIKYFSYIERIAIQIGSDVLEFANDVEKFTINGKPVEKQRVHHKTYLDRFVVRRDKKALSIRLTDRKQNGPKIDLIQRNIGWPAVIVDGGDTDMFAGSLGLLGQWETGKKIARDGNTEMNKEDATDYALEWQVRDTEPMLFSEARFPQFPTQCTPPAKVLGNRLGMKRAREEAAKACAGWKHDQDDCIFDVMATRDFSVAAEGSITAA